MPAVTSQHPIPIKIFGLQRTGTNLMQALLTRNFHVKYLQEGPTGWKHGPPSRVCFAYKGIPTRFLLCIKNPYAWLVSCYRYFCRAGGADLTIPKQFVADPRMSFEEFVRRRTYEFPNPVHRWNFMNRCWLATLPAEHTIIVRQENQLTTELQVQMLEEIEQKFGFRRQGAELAGTEEQIDVNTMVRGQVDRDRYVLRKYMADYTPALLDDVNEMLDWDLMGIFGYAREDWTLDHREIRGLRLWIRQCTSDGRDAWAASSDRYQLQTIRQTDPDVRGVLDIGAHIGATALLIKRLWPECYIHAYEPCLENFRMLRLNTVDLADIRSVPAAVTDGASEAAFFGGAEQSIDDLEETGAATVCADGDRHVPAIGLANAVADAEHVDLLKIGCATAAQIILTSAEAGKVLPHIRWVLGRLPPAGPDRDFLVQALSQSHQLKAHSVAGVEYFVAQRSVSIAVTTL
jgi:FkbM family methyltransferase